MTQHPNHHTPVWTRVVGRCSSFREFMARSNSGEFLDEVNEPPSTMDLCRGDDFDRHPLLVTPGSNFRSILVSGEIRDGKGYHPMATWRDCARFPQTGT